MYKYNKTNGAFRHKMILSSKRNTNETCNEASNSNTAKVVKSVSQ